MLGKASCIVDQLNQYVTDGNEFVFVNKKNQELSPELKASVKTSDEYILQLKDKVTNEKIKWSDPNATFDLKFELAINDALVETDSNQTKELLDTYRNELQKNLINLDSHVKFSDKIYLSPFLLSTTSPSYAETQQSVRARFADTPILGRPELTPSFLGVEESSSLTSSSSMNSTDSNNSVYLQ